MDAREILDGAIRAYESGLGHCKEKYWTRGDGTGGDGAMGLFGDDVGNICITGAIFRAAGKELSVKYSTGRCYPLETVFRAVRRALYLRPKMPKYRPYKKSSGKSEQGRYVLICWNNREETSKSDVLDALKRAYEFIPPRKNVSACVPSMVERSRP